MTTYSLSTYTIRIYDSGGNTLQADNFSGHNNLLLLLESYLRSLKEGYYQNKRDAYVLHVRDLEKVGRLLHGRMEKGGYGIESEIFNTRSKKVSYQRIRTDAELLPYYFLFAVPKGARDAIAIFQMSSGTGIQADFEELFREFFEENFPSLRISIDRLVLRKYAQQLLRRGRITQVRLVKHGVPHDLADMVRMGLIEADGEMEYRVRAKRGKAFNVEGRIEQVLDETRDVKDFLPTGILDYDDVKIQLEADGKQRVVNLGHLQRTRAPSEYDITGELEGQDRNPDYLEIKKIATRLYQKLADDLDLNG
jgi:hypothetical protein